MEVPKPGNITAIVLAGGRSVRMEGYDKSMLAINGIPMIEHIVNQLASRFREVIISGEPGKYGFLGHRVIADKTPGMGPLMGLFTSLSASSTGLNFLTACDIPDINCQVVEKMLEQSEGYDIIMTVSEVSKYEPLHAIYRKTVLPAVEKMLGEGNLKLSDLAGKVRTRFIISEDRWYQNINNREDYERYREGTRDGKQQC